MAGIIDQGGYENTPIVLEAVDCRGVLSDLPEMRIIQAQDRADQNLGDDPVGNNQHGLFRVVLHDSGKAFPGPGSHLGKVLPSGKGDHLWPLPPDPVEI